jgi:hypothetical protein
MERQVAAHAGADGVVVARTSIAARGAPAARHHRRSKLAISRRRILLLRATARYCGHAAKVGWSLTGCLAYAPRCSAEAAGAFWCEGRPLTAKPHRQTRQGQCGPLPVRRMQGGLDLLEPKRPFRNWLSGVLAASAAFPVIASAHPRCVVPPALQNAAFFSSAKPTSSSRRAFDTAKTQGPLPRS